MSDFDPPEFAAPSWQVQRDDDARRLESALSETATKLGMKIRVAHDASEWAFRIYARLLSPNEVCMIDEPVLVQQPSGSTALVDLLQMALEALQIQLHDNMAAAMQKTDVRERQFGLSKEDKHTLHDMFMDAMNERMRYFSCSESNAKVVDKYQELTNRLYR